MLYEYRNKHQSYDNEQIKADFNALYQRMHGMPMKEIDKVAYVVYDLCRDYELSDFIKGVKIGIWLAEEIE